MLSDQRCGADWLAPAAHCRHVAAQPDLAAAFGNGGNLVCCDNCPAAWHVECIPSGKQRTAAQLPVQQLVVPRLRHRGGALLA